MIYMSLISLVVIVCIGIGIYAYLNPEAFKQGLNNLNGKQGNNNEHDSMSHPESHIPDRQPTTPQNRVLQSIDKIHTELVSIAKQQSTISNNLSQKIEDLNNAVSELKLQCQNMLNEMTHLQTKLPQTAPVITKESTVTYPIVYYAEVVDSQNPLGFTKSGLMRNNDKCFFEIIQSGDTEATYSIIAEKAVQEAAVTLFNPLITDSSEYDGIPPYLNSVYTTQVGKLKLADGVWKIVNKQKVKIV